MAIHISKQAPSGCHDAVAEYLSRPHARPIMSGVDVENAGASEPFPVYIIGPDAILERQLPTEPRHWRQLLVRGGTVVGEADLASNNGRARVVAIHRGPRGVATAKALEGAYALDRVQTVDYELRMLESPAIHLVALWLHASEDEVLLAIEPDMTGLPRHQPLTIEEAWPRLRDLAGLVRQTDGELPGQGN